MDLLMIVLLVILFDLIFDGSAPLPLALSYSAMCGEQCGVHLEMVSWTDSGKCSELRTEDQQDIA
jgi:hypothetical protein